MSPLDTQLHRAPICRWFVHTAALSVIVCAAAERSTAQESPDASAHYSKLPANQWVLIHDEDSAGGKQFARAVFADNVGRMYLWGTGGNKPARNVYQRYELESFDASTQRWQPAFPKSKQGEWTAENYPPFRIWGQTGPDGLNWDEGPRLQVVGGYHSTNRIRWWDFDGVQRPSPALTFNMACWDSKRARIVYYSDGQTFALDPKTNSWTNLDAKNHPTTCRALAWASMCYDPLGDRILLFGGGLATNPSGAAPTWIYDCAKNHWRRLVSQNEPPPRCNASLTYDPLTRSMVLFGGYNQAAALNDVWVFDCDKDQWEQRQSKIMPPPMYAPAGTMAPAGGTLLVCGNDARNVRMDHQATSTAQKETWAYDVKANMWKAINNELQLAGYSWLTAAASAKDGIVFLVAFGPRRKTFALRFDNSRDAVDLPGAKANSIAWKYPEQKRSLEDAPAPMPEDHAKFIASLPANTFANARPPGMLISKTWSTAVIDTDNSEVIYTGGGHSGYSGNDFARYSIASNRWSLDQPPRFPPFLEGTNAGIYGWSYGMMPFSQHTYLWYCYDPASKTVLYLARPSFPTGTELQLTDDVEDVLIYDEKKHGYASWVYDLQAKKMHRPSFGRPFANPWHLTLCGTPGGVFAMSDEKLYHAVVDAASGAVDWKLVDSEFPRPAEKIKYHYEFQPLLHDSKRNRLVQLKGDRERVDVYVREVLPEAKWEQLSPQGTAAIGREATYIPQHDTILWLGDKLHAYDCAANRMGELDVELPAGLYGHECALAYDAKHDLCVALLPKSFSGPMQTFYFRFDPAAAKYK